MDEAGQRISQFLLAQTLINLAFGALITAGLFLIGLPYAALWGFSAAVLRFVPFVGVFFATVMPAAVAFILFEGWTPTLATLGLFLVADLVTAYVVEPLGIGYRTGVSSLALLVMAMIWTWLWGPIGLLLSTPITVCLATLGKHVPSLEFLNVVLGDAAPLPAHAAYYQRLLARDDDEAGEIIEQELATRSRLEVFDQVLIPALAWATRDRAREDITQAEQQFVLDVTEAMISEAGERSDEGAVGQPHPETEESLGKVFGVPARGAGDDLVLEMLGRLLDSAEVSFERISPSVLVAELIEKSREERPQVICIGSLPPGGLHQARYLCKRLRAVFPKLRIVVLRPCADQEEREGGARLQDAGVDLVAWSLGDAVSEIERALKTVAASLPSADSAPAGPADEGREVASA
jgi:hypothetical protein